VYFVLQIHHILNTIKLTILSFLLSFSASSQEIESTESLADSKKMNLEVSLNSTGFIQQFLFATNLGLTQNPYLVQLKLLNSKRNGLRFGGATTSSGTRLNDVNNGSTTKLTFSNYDFRLGFELHSKLGKRWSTFYGVDGVFGNSQSRQESQFFDGVSNQITKINSDVLSYGGGPFIGLQFAINERIRIYTESTAYFKLTEDKQLVESTGVFGSKSESKTNGHSFNLIMPASLFIAINF
jgi:hypothetical protein